MSDSPFRPFELPTSGGGHGASQRAADAIEAARAAQQQNDELRGQVDRLQMICEAMWTLMKAKSGATEAEIVALIEEIDLRDGKLNGRTELVPQKCARCGRVVSLRTSLCPYCGAQNFRTTAF